MRKFPKTFHGKYEHRNRFSAGGGRLTQAGKEDGIFRLPNAVPTFICSHPSMASDFAIVMITWAARPLRAQRCLDMVSTCLGATAIWQRVQLPILVVS